MAYIPPDNLAYALLLEFPNGGSGSGFFLSTEKEQFLVTAKHVMYDEKGNLRSATVRLTCPAQKEDEHSTQYEINLSRATVLPHSTADVVVVLVGTHTPVEGDPQAHMVTHALGIQLLRSAPSGPVTVILGNVKCMKDATIGNDVLLYGYPTSLGLKNSPQFDYNKPLLRKGVLAGVSKARGTLVLDCPAYPGNSGGPVVEVEDRNLLKVHRVVGVVSQFVPQLHQRYSPYTGKPLEPEMFNSGYSIAVAMDKVLDLLTATLEKSAPVVTSNTMERLSTERVGAITSLEPSDAQEQGRV